MSDDFTDDVRDFLLNYPLVEQMTQLSKMALRRVYGRLQAEIVRRDWYNAHEFRSAISERWIQIWKHHWHPSVNPGCPWIHMEYFLNWGRGFVECRLDIEGGGAPRDAVLKMGKLLCATLTTQKPAWLNEGGWILSDAGRNSVVLLIKDQEVPKDAAFSSRWMIHRGIELLDGLSHVMPTVDEAVVAFQEKR